MSTYTQPTTSQISIPIVPNSDILRINQANSSEPVYFSVGRFYSNPSFQAAPPPPSNVTWITARDQLTHYQRPDTEVHRIPTQSQALHCHNPEEIYLSSVLPSRTPRELRHFQDHCWDTYQPQEGTDITFQHDLNQIHTISTSALHFQNFLWRFRTILGLDGITEEFYIIRRRTRPDHPDRPYLEPAYTVSYPWVGTFWTTTQLERPLPPRPSL